MLHNVFLRPCRWLQGRGSHFLQGTSAPGRRAETHPGRATISDFPSISFCCRGGAQWNNFHDRIWQSHAWLLALANQKRNANTLALPEICARVVPPSPC